MSTVKASKNGKSAFEGMEYVLCFRSLDTSVEKSNTTMLRLTAGNGMSTGTFLSVMNVGGTVLSEVMLRGDQDLPADSEKTRRASGSRKHSTSPPAAGIRHKRNHGLVCNAVLGNPMRLEVHIPFVVRIRARTNWGECEDPMGYPGGNFIRSKDGNSIFQIHEFDIESCLVAIRGRRVIKNRPKHITTGISKAVNRCIQKVIEGFPR